MGSIPTLVTDMIPWSNGEDTCVGHRRAALVWGHSTEWSVSVSVARRCGKAEGRVQFPDGPLDEMGLHADGGELGLHPDCDGFDSHEVH